MPSNDCNGSYIHLVMQTGLLSWETRVKVVQSDEHGCTTHLNQQQQQQQQQQQEWTLVEHDRPLEIRV